MRLYRVLRDVPAQFTRFPKSAQQKFETNILNFIFFYRKIFRIKILEKKLNYESFQIENKKCTLFVSKKGLLKFKL